MNQKHIKGLENNIKSYFVDKSELAYYDILPTDIAMQNFLPKLSLAV